MRGIRRLVMAIAVSGLVAACAIVGPTPQPPRTPSPSPSPSPSPTASPTDTKAVGRHAVHVDGIDVATGVMRFTDAVIFFDEEAHRAAREDGQSGGAPNPVWIRDLATTGQYPIAPDARVRLWAITPQGDRALRETTVATLVSVVNGTAPPGQWDGGLYLFIIVNDGRITEIEEPELP